MIDPILVRGTITYASILALSAIGLALAYMTTKVPSFVQGAFAGIGGYVSFTFVRIVRVSPYISIPVSFILSGLAALALYEVLVKPLRKRGASLVMLMMSTITFDIILVAILNIVADYLTLVSRTDARGFSLQYSDFNFIDLPGVFIVSLTLAIGTTIILYLFLNRTKLGIALRAAVENPELAQTIGLNIEAAYVLSWFLSGSLAGIAGSLIPLWSSGTIEYFDTNLLLSMFVAVVIGGIGNIYGALIGGYLVGFIEILGTYILSGIIGNWIITYKQVLSLLAMVITLLIAPKGLMSINWKKILRWT
ncbi:MAG: branched-chain amino acid ABC transporter permease [Thermoprotei archaeon]|jgi:branched-chain amino acid transport system permease protein